MARPWWHRVSVHFTAACGGGAMELSKIYSVKGMLARKERSACAAPVPGAASHRVRGLTGGGRIPQPGEISLAHKGVLFLDELPEFARETVEALRPAAGREGGSSGTSWRLCLSADFYAGAYMNPVPVRLLSRYAEMQVYADGDPPVLREDQPADLRPD